MLPCELRSTILIAALCGSPSSSSPRGLLAQGIATAAIHGTVRAEDGRSVEGAQVRVLNTATGFSVATEVRHGRFLVQGVEVGGPYVVEVRRIGFAAQQSQRLFLTLGEALEVRFVMRATATPLDTVLVVGTEPTTVARTGGGLGTTFSDSLLHRLPTLNGNFFDFVRLAPQISTKIGLPTGGLSGGGVLFRFNNYLIDGAPERFLTGNSSLAFGGGKSVPLEAVKEYQVLITPFDVRYGDFAGALVNSVTKSGTNQLRGSVFAHARNDHLARRGELAPGTPYERLQFGFSLGGPILRDRLHFFVAPELQRLTSSAPGPYLGQPPTATPPVPVSAAVIARLDEIMRGYGLVAGSGGPVQNGTPLANVFARLDLAIPAWNSRAMASVNYARTTATTFSRTAADTFALSTYQLSQPFASRLTSVQLHTMLRRAGGGHNEARVSHRVDRGDWLSPVNQPILRVAVPSGSGGVVTVQSGTHESAQGMFTRTWSLHFADRLTLPVGAGHVVTLGVEAERFHIARGGVIGSYGTWSFSSLDSLERRIAERFQILRDFGSAGVPLAGGQYAVYAGDQWRAGERLHVTVGLRADLLAVNGRPPYDPIVDSIFQRRTDEMPSHRVHLSPRLGFTWDLFGTGRDQLRGGAGVFTGRPPLNWAHSALYSYGVGIGTLRCGLLPRDAGPPPPFVPDYRAAPTACASGPGLTTAPLGDVDLLDRRLRLAQTLRGSFAYDRRLPWNLLATTEVLITRHISDFVFVNLNLVGPQAVDRQGRVLYGTILPRGDAAPEQRSGFSEVVDLRNTSKNYSYQLSQRIEKRSASGVAAMALYTYSHVRDVQTPLRAGTRGIVVWAGARAVSGRHEDLSPGISLNDIPHRIVLAGTYTAPWRRWSTTVSFYYVGESGSPFTYIAGGWVGAATSTPTARTRTIRSTSRGAPSIPARSGSAACPTRPAPTARRRRRRSVWAASKRLSSGSSNARRVCGGSGGASYSAIAAASRGRTPPSPRYDKPFRSAQARWKRSSTCSTSSTC